MSATILFDDVGVADVRVDLRGRNIGMAEHRLHRAQIGAALDQVGGKGVA